MQRQRGKGMVVVEPKSERSRRTVHLAEGTVTTLREHKRRQAAERLAAGPLCQDNGLVFCNTTGGPLDPAQANEAFHQALERVALPKVRVHDLRHSCASLLLSHGVHPKIVQDLLGHSNITLTLDTYSHVIPALPMEAAHKMNALFCRPARKTPDGFAVSFCRQDGAGRPLASAAGQGGYKMQQSEAAHASILWRECVGVEPTPRRAGAEATVLKTARPTGTHALPYRHHYRRRYVQ